MRHGDVCWVRVRDGEDPVLARYTQYDDFPGYWTFFGTDHSLRTDQLEVVRQTDLRSE